MSSARQSVSQKDLDKILNGYFWPKKLKGRDSYLTTHDDNDGDPSSGYLAIEFSNDGDAWIKTSGPMLRYRMPGIGGGKSPKIRNALLLLAEAIRQEGQEP